MNKKSIALIMIIAVACTVITACGSTGNKQDQVVGTWEMSSISTGDTRVSAGDYLKSAGVSKIPTVIFKENYTVKFTGLGKDVDPNGKWTGKNGSYSIEDGTTTLKTTINDAGKLEILYPKNGSEHLSADMTMVFKKKTEN